MPWKVLPPKCCKTCACHAKCTVLSPKWGLKFHANTMQTEVPASSYPEKFQNLPTYYPPTIPHLLCRRRQKIPREIWVPRRWLRWSLLWSAAEAVDAPRPRSQVESVHHLVNARVLLGISWKLLLWQSMTHIPSHSKTPCFQWSFRSFLLDCLPQWPQFLILAVLAPHRIGASKARSLRRFFEKSYHRGVDARGAAPRRDDYSVYIP